MQTKPAIPRVTYFADTDLMHGSYLFTGLSDLARSGAIALTTKLPSRPWRERGRDQATTFLLVHDGRREIPVAADFRDGAARFCPVLIDRVALYAKANYSQQIVRASLGARAELVRPFGLYTTTRLDREVDARLRVAGSAVALARAALVNSDGQALGPRARAFAMSARRRRRYLSRPSMSEMRHEPWSGTAATVFFQSTCWPEESGDRAELNEFRRDLILALRERLGGAFIGGFRPDGVAAERYPEALAPTPLDDRAFAQQVARSAIGINTLGTTRCFSWRFVELFAAGRAIVSQVQQNEVGRPLGRDEGVIFGNSPDELADAARELVQDAALARELAVRARQTFDSYLAPAPAAERLVLGALDLGST